MQKLDLSDVTMVCIDDVNTEKAIRVLEHCMKEINFGSVKLFTSKFLPKRSDIEIIHCAPIKDSADYSCFVLRNLVDYIDTDYMLIVQVDGYIYNAKAWNPKFKEFDYIGAPWYIGTCVIEGLPETTIENCVGNGGFSLRSKRIMTKTREIIFKNRDPLIHPEDAYMCRKIRAELESEGMTFASMVLAREFSLENNHIDEPYGNQFGWHGWRTKKNNPQLDVIE